MTQKQMVTEKDMFLQTFENECRTTLKVLKAFPQTHGDYRPHERSRTAKELAWTFVQEQGVAERALAGKLDFTQRQPAPTGGFADALTAFEQASRETAGRVAKATDDALQRTMKFPTGPGRMGDLRAMDVLWMTLMDQVHHRGQLSVYVRLAGGKVPSIYGPTADEPWM